MKTYTESNELQKDMILRAVFGKEAFNEEYEDDIEYVYKTLKMDIMNEYLVHGALLSCEKATYSKIDVGGEDFYTRTNGKSRLGVHHSANIEEMPCANISDTRPRVNISPFGNCTDRLTGEDICRLKGIPGARQEGICKYLMRLSKYWEKLPSVDNDNFDAEGYPMITMQSRLFCNRGAFIFPITSGQKVVIYEDILSAMSLEDVRFANENNMTGKEMVIFREIRQYFKDVPVLEQSSVIFAFEGLGSGSGNTNNWHPDGQFNALFVICMEGQATYITRNGSTLPDTKSNAVIKDGVYKAIYRNHHDEYAALQLRVDEVMDKIENEDLKKRMQENIDIRGAEADEDDIPAIRYRELYKQPANSASGVNVHHANGPLTNHSRNSEGCLNVPESEYEEFKVAEGFPAGKKKHSSEQEFKFWGYVVVDRNYMDKIQKEVFFGKGEN